MAADTQVEQEQAPPSEAPAAVAGAAASLAPVVVAGTVGAAAAARAAQGATSIIQSLLSGLTSGGDSDAAVYALVLGLLEDKFPDRPRADLAALARTEVDYERQWRAKMVQRLQRDLPRALAITNEATRRQAVQRVLDREKRIYGQRREAMQVRALARADQLYLQDSSPRGAYWKLSPYVSEHTLDCLAMGEKFWPWEVLREMGPPRHHGCPCYLLGLDEAKRLGLMTDADVPADPGAAYARAHRMLAAVEEAMFDGLIGPDVVAEYVSLLEAAEAEARELGEAHHIMRWAKGDHQGGQFRPHRGGHSEPLTKLSRILHDLPKAPTAPKPWAPHAGTRSQGLGIPSYDGVELKRGSSAGGSNGARWATDEHGDRWLVKTYGGNEDRVATEALANAVYREMGARVARAGTIRSQIDPDFRDIPDARISEPPLPEKKPGERISTGMVVREPDGRVWIVRPKGGYGGYDATLPKGGLEWGLSAQQNAHKELWEETGLQATVTGFAADLPGDTGTTRFYTAVRTGGTPLEPDATPFVKGGRETETVELMAPEDARKALNRERDRQALDAALKHPLPLPGSVVPNDFPPTAARALAYPTLDGSPRSRPFKKGPSHALGEHFMTDALLGNWDFVGLEDDNVLWDEDGNPIRVDQGGTFEFRAQGKPKPFGPVPTEAWTMLGPKGQGFRSVAPTAQEKRQQAAAIAQRLTPERVDQLVDAAPFADDAMRERIRENLKARVAWMGRYANGEEHEPVPLAGDAADKALRDGIDLGAIEPDERWAIDVWGEDEGEINDALRSKVPLTARDADAVRLLDGLVTAGAAPDDLVVHVPVSAAGDPGMVGKTFRDPGYLDGSLDPVDGPTIRVTVPKGSPLLYAPTVGDHARRVLLPRGSRLAIVRSTPPILDAVLDPHPASYPKKP